MSLLCGVSPTVYRVPYSRSKPFLLWTSVLERDGRSKKKKERVTHMMCGKYTVPGKVRNCSERSCVCIREGLVQGLGFYTHVNHLVWIGIRFPYLTRSDSVSNIGRVRRN